LLKGLALIIPVATDGRIEFDSVVKKDLKLKGMGRNKRKFNYKQL